MSAEALYEFEAYVDKFIAGIPLWEAPLRTVMSNYILVADSLFNGPRFMLGGSPDPDKGSELLSRLSYLSNFLRKTRPDVGANLLDALNALRVDELDQIKLTLAYAHFCEIVPQVRNGHLSVKEVPGGFKLVHPNPEFTIYEELDVVASELSLGFVNDMHRRDPRAFLKLANDWPHLQTSELKGVLASAYAHYCHHVSEERYLGEEVYLPALGFDNRSLRDFRAAFMAFCSWCLGMSAAAEAEGLHTRGSKALHWHSECVEWAAPLLKSDFVYNTIHELTGIHIETIKTIASYYTDDPFGELGMSSGEGFSAPITVLGSHLLISPRAATTMMAERNILYVLNRRDRRRFDNLVSQSLEPALLEAAESLFRLSGYKNIQRNIVWKHGEIDLLVYDEITNTALHVQAKAPIPPQGARMTRQVETNTIKAIAQINVFEDQTSSFKDDIVRKTFGHEASDVRWASAVLTRSSFGTSKAWISLKKIAPLNLPLLRFSLESLCGEGYRDLSRIPEFSNNIVRYIAEHVSQGWEDQILHLFGKSIEYPSLNLDYRRIAEIQEGLRNEQSGCWI
ncbi:hypothetical protein ACFZ8E_15125 [Methylobacterium sp. HMF5984]|uniref:hypothetical protein n=1 Tax=Methylobacterium sp. HMF5984 TaxID=3367370 RepID=UPI003854145C